MAPPSPTPVTGKDRTGRGAHGLEGLRFLLPWLGLLLAFFSDPSWGDQAIARPWPGAGDQAMAATRAVVYR